MSIYRKLIDLSNSQLGSLLPPELIDEISKPLFMGTQITLEEILSLEEKQLDRELKRQFVRIIPEWDYTEKLREVLTVLSANLSTEEEIISQHPLFYKYLEMSQDDIRKLVEEIRVPFESNLKNIKYLVVQEILSPDKIQKRRSKASKLHGSVLKFMLLYPVEYARSYFTLFKYSPLNRYMIISQMMKRGIPISPVRTFIQWKKLGAKINKGEKSIAIYVPNVIYYEDKYGEKQSYTEFSFRNILFAQSQTSFKDKSPILPDEYQSIETWSGLNLINNVIKHNLVNSLPENIETEPDNKILDHVLKAMIRSFAGQMMYSDDQREAIFWLSRSIVRYILGLTKEEPSHVSGYLQFIKPDNFYFVSTLIENIVKYGFPHEKTVTD
jgi:hypothetical protein